jgi:hypothetical protein
LFPAAFAVDITHPHWARVVGYDPFSLCVIHKEGLFPSSGDINTLMVIEVRSCYSPLSRPNLELSDQLKILNVTID